MANEYEKGGIKFRRNNNGSLERVDKPKQVALNAKAKSVLSRPKNVSSNQPTSSGAVASVPTGGQSPLSTVGEGSVSPAPQGDWSNVKTLDEPQAPVESSGVSNGEIGVDDPRMTDASFLKNLQDAKDAPGRPTVGQFVSAASVIALIAAFGPVAATGAAGGRLALNAADNVAIGTAPIVETAAFKGLSPAAKLIYGQNTWRAAKSTSYLTKLASGFKNPILAASLLGGVVTSAAGTYLWNGHLVLDNVVGGYSLAARDMREAGHEDLAIEFEQAIDDFLNPNFLGKVARATPFANMARTFTEGAQQAIMVNKAWKTVRERISSGELASNGSNVDWDKVRADELIQQQAIADIHYDNKVKILEFEAEARDNERLEEAAFWAKVQKDKDAAAKKSKEEEAAFWLEYRKALLRLQEDGTRTVGTKSTYEAPSNLNFGLLR